MVDLTTKQAMGRLMPSTGYEILDHLLLDGLEDIEECEKYIRYLRGILNGPFLGPYSGSGEVVGMDYVSNNCVEFHYAIDGISTIRVRLSIEEIIDLLVKWLEALKSLKEGA